MTYKDNFVVEVKCNGKIMRVKNDSTYLPYGSEYSLLLKNLNSRKASIHVHIDGQDVLDYSSLILEPNSTSELKGFFNGSVVKNNFKFIHKTKEIQDHRGDKVDDGLIRVEFAFEKPPSEIIKKTILHEHHHHDPFYWNHHDWFYGDSTVKYSSSMPLSSYTVNDSGDKDVMRGVVENSSGNFDSCESINYVQADSLGVESLGQPLDDEGITVKGSDCHQAFRYGAIGELEQSKVITLQLKGMSGGGAAVQTPLTIKTRLECSSCGKKSKSSFKYCPSCGTYLE